MHLLKNFATGGNSNAAKPGQPAPVGKSSYFSSLNLA